MSSPFRICVIGPESTGKSELSAFLAQHYRTTWVPEYAREYIGALQRPYVQDDLLHIARGQVRLEEERSAGAREVLIMDTNLLVIKVWSEHRFGLVVPEIIRLHRSRRYDLYLLTDIDIPWAADPQREHPHLREHFMSVYHAEVSSSGVPFRIVSGLGEQRNRSAVEAVDPFLNGTNA